ncbi:hypothetical protein WA026_001088 [Henosepilachna vigintioctopunctata]|uniref:Neprilysin n=1 Tax=Henosepilachna vigintioctopunctata TaxID=420089 RepID=A0AAW1V660_9CUCU
MEYQPVKQDNFFRRRNRTEKLLCTLLVIVIIIAIVLAIFLVMALTKDKKKEEKEETFSVNKLCQTPTCLASQIMWNANTSVDPCDDFFEFACGGFIKKSIIAPGRSSTDSFSSLSNVIDQQIHSILVEPLKDDDSKIIKIVKKLYSACMNETDIEINSVPALKNNLKKLGGWPVVEGNKWNPDSFNWVDTLLKLKESGMVYTMLLDFPVELDNKNSSRRVLCVDQPFVPFESLKRGPRDNPVLNAAYKFMVDIAVEFGAERKLAEREMEEALKFEMDMAKIMVPQEDRRDLEEEYHPISIKDLEGNYTFLPWHNFINRLIAPSSMTYEDKLIVYLPEYLDRLQKLINRTSRRVLANFILYKATGSLITYSTKKLKDIQQQFTKAAVGVGTSRPRDEQCTSVASRLDVAVGAIYIRKYFDKKAKINTEEIVRNIEAEFVETLKKVDWMDSNTKNAALDKLDAMEKYIGYPDELMSDSKMDEYYKDLEINSDNYLEVVLNVSKFQTEKDMKQLSEPVIKSDWRTRSGVAVVNAFYDLNSNAIQVPAGILQGVFFDANRPQYLNYGGIGYIIGHEFTHGFDDEGSQMDRDGNLRAWWKESTKDAYNKKAKCIVDQYSRTVVPEINMTINGINTQGENIADNGGIKLAYRAYKNWASRNNPEPKLPGLNYTANQMFWIAAANTWCTKMKPQAMKHEILTEVHPPDRYRINVPLANSKYFASDFNCPAGSNMNPIQQCSVW